MYFMQASETLGAAVEWPSLIRCHRRSYASIAAVDQAQAVSKNEVERKREREAATTLLSRFSDAHTGAGGEKKRTKRKNREV